MKNLITDNNQSISLNDRQFLASGGEADIYVNGGIAYRIHHGNKINTPKQKLTELSKISDNNVIKPINLLFNAADSSLVGFTMKYIKDTEPLCKYFTLSFKKQNKISNKETNDLVKNIQKTICSVHKQRFLIVDLNELNILVGQNHIEPYFIDVGSWQTPSFPATAIMESIRDPLVKNNHFTEGSDWFSFAILAFQVYIGIHPYKGKHPNYQPNEWSKRMKDGISVFDKQSSVPSICVPFNSISSKYLDWFKSVFTKNLRDAPPLPDVVIQAIPKQINIVKSSSKFEVLEIFSYSEDILDIQVILGKEIFFTKNTIITKNKNYDLSKFRNIKKVLVCQIELNNELVIIIDFGGKILFYNQNLIEIDSTDSKSSFYRNSCIYTICGGSLIENSFVKLGNKYIVKTNILDNVSEVSAKIFEGLVFQNLLGKIWLTIPYAKNKSKSFYIKELDGFRIIEIKSIERIAIITAEKSGIFYRFIIIFDNDWFNYSIRIEKDCIFTDINFTVLDNGICILVSGDEECEIFRDNNRVNKLQKTPFDNETKLFNNGGVNFISNNSVFSVKMK